MDEKQWAKSATLMHMSTKLSQNVINVNYKATS